MDRVELVLKALGPIANHAGWLTPRREAERFIAAWDALMSVHAMATDMSRITTEAGASAGQYPATLPVTLAAAEVVCNALYADSGNAGLRPATVLDALRYAAKALAK